MKRKLISSLILIGVIFLGLLGYKHLGTVESNGGVPGLSKSYETLEDLKAEADLVVRVNVPLYYDIREFRGDGGTTKQAFYEVTVDEVFIDRTGQEFDEESEIVVKQIIGMKDRKETEYSSEQGMKPMKTGQYLLFLNKVRHPADGIVYYVSNSLHHLYRCKDDKTFKNIASDEVPEIVYSELTAEE